MKKLLAALVALLVVPIVLGADESVPITPGNPLGPGNENPEVFLALRLFDIGIDIDGSGSTVNPSNIRGANYAFTGEQLIYFALVRDHNGREDINVVRWVKMENQTNGTVEPEIQEGPCDLMFDGLDISQIYEWCEVYGEDVPICEGYTGIVDDLTSELTNLDYDYQTDQVYMCVLTVESQWGGEDPAIYIEAEDQSGGTGSMLPEMWTFNPPLTITLETSDGQPLSFGDVMDDQAPTCVTEPNCVRPINEEDQQTRNCELYECTIPGEKLCDIQFSTNKIVLTNDAGIVDLWPFIAATNFYAIDGMAKCPYTNELDANQFEYRATQGTWDSGWRVMPQYAPDIGCDGPSISNSCRGGCRITTGCPMNELSPGQSIEIALKLIWPTPCIGSFDVGTFYAIVRAI